MKASAPRAIPVEGSAAGIEMFLAAQPASEASHVRLTRLRTSLAPLATLSDLRHLELDDPSTLHGLAALRQLTSLTIYYFPHLHALDEIGALTNLRKLHLSTPPSYDASRKVHDVDSLEPIGRLTTLESLVMRGVLPRTSRLEPLHRLTQLARLEISHVFAFGIDDYARLARDLPNTEGHCLVPYFEAHWTGVCKRCGRPRVALTAPPPRTPRLLCAECNRARLEAHVAAWNAAKGVAT